MSVSIPKDMRANWLRRQALPLAPLVFSELDGEVRIDPQDRTMCRRICALPGFSWAVSDCGSFSSAVYMPGVYHFRLADLLAAHPGAILGRHLQDECCGQLGYVLARFRTTAFDGDSVRSIAPALVLRAPRPLSKNHLPAKRRLFITRAGPDAGVFMGTNDGTGVLNVEAGDCVRLSSETFIGLSPNLEGMLLEPAFTAAPDAAVGDAEPVITNMPAGLMADANRTSLNGSSFNWLARPETLERGTGLRLEWMGDADVHIHRVSMDARSSRRVFFKKRNNVATVSMIRGALDLAVHDRDPMRLTAGEDYLLPKGVHSFAFTSVSDPARGQLASGQALISMPGITRITSTVSTKVL